MLDLPLEVFSMLFKNHRNPWRNALHILLDTAALRGPDSFSCCEQIPTK